MGKIDVAALTVRAPQEAVAAWQKTIAEQGASFADDFGSWAVHLARVRGRTRVPPRGTASP